ncbi:MAG: hypothetical protein AAFY34_02105 [Pseudomonadota bacterium]
MIFLVWFFGLGAILASSALVRRAGLGDRAVIAVLLASLLAVISYVAVGRPNLPDQPYGKRIAEIDSRDATTLSRAETLALLEQRIREYPDSPQPHFFIGEILQSQGRERDAVRAFQSSLRRDPAFTPALIALADSLTRLNEGRIGVEAKRLYARAVAVDPAEARAGFMAGLADWQAGDRPLARSRWAAVGEGLPVGSTQAAMLASLVEQAEAGAFD